MATAEGYVYVPDSDHWKVALFAGAAPGTVIRKPDRSPPWIVVNHAIESAIVARWPGRLWRVAALDSEGVAQLGFLANCTRALAVEVLEEVPAARLFGERGEAVVTLLAFASQIDAATAELLGRQRHPAASQAYSRYEGVRSWAPYRASASPLNCGFSLLERAVRDRAELVAGPEAFVEDEEGERDLGPVWEAAASALREAAMAMGVPSIPSEDVAILLAAWNAVHR